MIPSFNRFVPFFLFFLCGCAVQPEPLTTQEIQRQADSDIRLLQLAKQPIDGPLTVYEAMARALVHNLDLQLERHKATLAEEQLRVTRHDQLPELVAGHLADGRNNFSGGSSRSLLTGQQSLESSTSSDRHVRSDDLGLSWNILDFGVSYYRAHQAADRLLLAEEQRRNVVNRILTDVQRTYWRAVSYQKLIAQLEDLDRKVARELEASRQIEERGLDRPLEALMQRRSLLDNKRELLMLYEGLMRAKFELASLMNLPMGETFYLIDDRPDVVRLPKFDMASLEQTALEQRSELREVAYQKRINANEIKAAFVDILPGISLNYAHNYNSNSLLFNSDWTDYSARISWNLMGAFRFPATRSLGRAQAATLDAQRLALGGAILTQVHVGAARLHHARNEYLLASDLHQTQRRIYEQLGYAVRADSVSEQALIAEEVNTLLSEVRYDVAYANVEGARADFYAAMGLHPSVEDLDTSTLSSMTESLRRYFERQRESF